MQRFNQILVYVGEGQTESALARAVGLALENDASLTLVDVVTPQAPFLSTFFGGTTDPDPLVQEVVDERRGRLLERTSEYSDTGVSLDVVVHVGDPATEIIRHVIRHNCDLVIKTADGEPGIRGTLFGSVARSLLRQCPCPVLILKPALHGEFDQVLAAVDVQHQDDDHRDLNHQILQLAKSVADEDNAELSVVAAWDLWMEGNLRRRDGDAEVDRILESHKKQAAQRLVALFDPLGIEEASVTRHLRRGEPSVVIREMVDQTRADLLVMGTVCRTGVTGFLIGNTAESVLSNVTCSVLALKPDGFVCPVELPEEPFRLVMQNS